MTVPVPVWLNAIDRRVEGPGLMSVQLGVVEQCYTPSLRFRRLCRSGSMAPPES
jgi:hypothetical protein